MGYCLATSRCYGCRTLMTYNPDLVPSIRVSLATGKPDENGVKEPVCRACVERVNPMRLKNGLEPIKILPGAYEAASEG